MRHSFKKRIIRQLSLAVLSGDHNVAGIARSMSDCLGLPLPLVEALARDIAATHSFSAYPTLAQSFLERTLLESRAFEALCRAPSLKIANWPLKDWTPKKLAIESPWQLPTLQTDVELAQFLGIQRNDLDWFSHRCKHRSPQSTRQQHYYYRRRIKANGSTRLLEIPKSRLREIQRIINTHILARVPVHECTHAFVKGRSVSSFVSNHVAKRAVLSLDLCDFYTAIPAGRVFKLFQAMAYPNNIAAYLAGCCLHTTATEQLQDLPPESQRLLRAPHLPQGAPTSPALANLAAFNLDIRLNALARSMGFEYSRYADDIAFSTDAANGIQRLFNKAILILADEGFSLNSQKTRLRTQNQQQRLCGLVVNEKINLPRKTIKVLEAELFNCVRYGVQSQNRKELANYRCHLQGRISHVTHYTPLKAEKLWALFDRIEWHA